MTETAANPAEAPGRPRVAVILTGGTIGSAGNNELDRLDYVDLAKLLTVDEAMPLYTFPEQVDVFFRPFPRIRSNDASTQFWLDLRTEISAILRDEPTTAGIVITHGTATLEETAYFLHLTVNTEVPIVLIGAQRPPTSIGSDAQTNLYNAVLLAASPAAVGHGVLVAMDDQILSARDVTKSSNHRLSTFQARDHGPLGDIDPYGGVWFYRKLLRRHTVTSQFATDDALTVFPRVEVIPVYAGVDGLAIDAAVERGVAGLIIASLPPSLNPATIDAAIERAQAAGVSVVQSSRAITGRVVQRHGFDDRGLASSDTLSPQGARLLLMLCLASGLSQREIVTAFAEY